MKTKKEKKFWFLHFTYVDMYGMQHRMKYKMPRDFQKNVACVMGQHANAELEYEEE